MRRKLLQFQSLLAQHALRWLPKPRPQLQPPHLHSPSALASAPPSPPVHLLWNRLSGATGASLLPKAALPGTAAAVAASARAAPSRWLEAARGGALDLFSLQRGRRTSGWKPPSFTFLHGVPWAYWIQSPDGVVLTLVGVNVAVFLLWHVADPGFMRRHFMISLDNLKGGRFHTMLTCAFSHAEFDHLFTNMIGLYFFGTAIAHMFGPVFLLELYAAGALAGSTFLLLDNAFLAPRKQVYAGWDPSRASGLGASAAVNAIILLEIFLFPKRLIYLYFLVPIPAAIMGAALIGADLWRVKKGEGNVSGSAHLGGALVAAILWARIKKRWI